MQKSHSNRYEEQYQILMRKQKQKKRKNSISRSEQELHSSQNYSQNRKKMLSLRQIKQNYATLPANPENNLHHSKSALVQKLSEQLRSKLNMDIHACNAIESEDASKIKRLRKIETEIQKINQQNTLKIKQLAEMQTTFLKKIEKQMNKDKQIEERLIHQYELLMKEDQKIYVTREVKKLKEKQDWVIIQQEQRRLELLARGFEKRQLEMGRYKSSEPRTTKKKGEVQEEEQLKKHKGKAVKRERKKKNVEELKQMGRQFLEYAKKAQAQKLKENFKLLDIYKKSIDYLPQIKTILKNKGVDLSRPVDLNQSATKLKRKKNSPAKIAKQQF